MKEILKHLVEHITLPEDAYLDQDAEILEIFVEELEEIFESLQPMLEQWSVDSSNQDILVNIRRFFHTLKGSGRMVGAKQSGELAWTVEDTLNRVIAKNLDLNSTVQSYVNTVFNIYKYKLYPEFLNKQPHHLSLAPLVLLGQQIQAKQSIEPALEDLLKLANSLDNENVNTGLELSTAEPEAQEIVETTTQHIDHATDESLVSETLAIFIEESEEHLATIQEFLKLEQHNPEQYNKLVRALHTLRGSSSMAHVDDVFEVSGKVENLFKALVQEDTATTQKENTLLNHYVDFVQEYLNELRLDGVQSSKLKPIYQKFNDAWEHYDFQVNEQDSQEGLVSQLVALEIDLLLDAELEFDKRAKAEYPAYFEELSEQAQLLTEHTDNRAAIGIRDFSLALKDSYDQVIQKQALLNTDYIFEIYEKVHQEFIHLFDTLASGQRVILSESTLALLAELKDYVHQEIDALAETQPQLQVETSSKSEPTQVVNDSVGNFVTTQIAKDKTAIQSENHQQDFDADVLDIFIEEADELLVEMDHDLNTWANSASDTTALNNLMRHLHTLKGGANMVQATHIGLIAHELESIYERVIKGQLQTTPQMIQSIRLIQDDVADRIQLIRDKAIDYPADHVLEVLRNIEQGGTGAFETDQNAAPVQQVDEVKADSVAIEHAEHAVENESTPAEEVQSLVATELDDGLDIADQVARETFIEEARELIDDGLKILSQWFDQRGNRSYLLQLQRIAHSLKGGAKMVKLEEVADISYELESAFEQFGLHNFNSNVYDGLLEQTFHWLDAAIFKRSYENFEGLRSNLRSIEYVDVSAQLPEKLSRTNLILEQSNFEFVQGDGTEPPSMLGEWDQSEKTETNNEMIRISADLVEKMIDLSGENAINRSRIEMDLGQLGNTLTDMELAIQRLADQLRRMEGELESQIIAKHGDLGSRYADFDPLEMDQYSSLNQLSKSLAESASDLVDFKTTLSDKIRDTEGLLLQQSRIQAEIQESLMRTRLVPFSRLLPRLQRLVRQTASTVNKPTELLVNNTEGELDRNILEKLVSPLEHMLRNAIDHGIEDAEQRQKLGKSPTGQIDLNISRQGTDVLVSFKDDGKGIDPEIIRNKAIEKGLLKADQHLESEEILQFIFHPGFSTAQQVTQISGRGVGLDVVQSEIKSLGGQVTVSSELGHGSTFTIRVPTTVAVSDALMVKVGDQQFAVPLSQIDRIVRISPAALEEYFDTQNDFFDIDFQSYKLRYLGEFTSNQVTPRLSGIAHSLPVLLIKGSMGQSIAILVDQLIGSRSQIVVKPIGKQFASINAIAGATILGDGHVCLILDGQNIARQVQGSTRGSAENIHMDKQRNRDQRRLIMIVDDSVTVRKVTSRLLERQGFDVITAKDGVDAIEQLENVKPDLMLLDIEMPRMDGFEVTNLVRHHEIHRDLPIIMITSRTGEKHRERAFSLGVTNYMGKPFQEADLLHNIDALLTVK